MYNSNNNYKICYKNKKINNLQLKIKKILNKYKIF